jgi:putative membrane protein
MDGWMGHMWNFWGMGWGIWFWLLLFIGVGYFFYISYRPRRYRVAREDPLEVAKLRLARGEITREEFEEIKKTLANSR